MAVSKISGVCTFLYKKRPFILWWVVVNCTGCISASSSSRLLGNAVSALWCVKLTFCHLLIISLFFSSSSQCPPEVWWLLFLLQVTDMRSLFPLRSMFETDTFFLFVWKCCSIIFYSSKQGWWILPSENALPVGAIMCAVTSPVIVFSTTLWKSLLLPCFCLRLLFLFFLPSALLKQVLGSSLS